MFKHFFLSLKVNLLIVRLTHFRLFVVVLRLDCRVLSSKISFASRHLKSVSPVVSQIDLQFEHGGIKYLPISYVVMCSLRIRDSFNLVR